MTLATTLQTIDQVLSHPEMGVDLAGLVNDLKNPTSNEAVNFYAGVVGALQIAEGLATLIGKSVPYVGGALDIASLGANSLKAANDIQTLGYIQAETALATASDLTGLAGNVSLAAATAASAGLLPISAGLLAAVGIVAVAGSVVLAAAALAQDDNAPVSSYSISSSMICKPCLSYLEMHYKMLSMRYRILPKM